MLSIGPALVVLVVYLLAIMRLTRLINADTVTDFIRVWIGSRVRAHELQTDEAFSHAQLVTARSHAAKAERWRKAFEFVQCPWCVGFWWALLGAVPVVWIIKYGWTLDWWAILPIALAGSHVVGVAARFADTEEISVEEAGDEDDAT